MDSGKTAWSRATRVGIALLIVCMSGVQACFAQDHRYEDAPTSITVNYSDLNLASKEGARALYQRLVDDLVAGDDASVSVDIVARKRHVRYGRAWIFDVRSSLAEAALPLRANCRNRFNVIAR